MKIARRYSERDACGYASSFDEITRCGHSNRKFLVAICHRDRVLQFLVIKLRRSQSARGSIRLSPSALVFSRDIRSIHGAILKRLDAKSIKKCLASLIYIYFIFLYYLFIIIFNIIIINIITTYIYTLIIS